MLSMTSFAFVSHFLVDVSGNGMMASTCVTQKDVQAEATMAEIMEEFTKEFHAQLTDMRDQGLFCDVLINFPDEGKKIYVHRAVMASCSLYFRALFTSQMKESGQAAIEIPGIRHGDMEAIVRYAYTRHANLNSNNIENVLCAADRLHVFGLVKICSDFLRESLCVENSIGIMRLAQYFNCPNLAKESRWFVLRNIAHIVSRNSEFQSLNINELCELLQADELNFPEEDEVVQAIMNWVKFDEKARKKHYFSLLSSTRLGLVRVRTFEDCLLRNWDISKSPDCAALVKKGYKLCEINQQCRIPFLQGTSNPMLRPRVPHEVIFVLGGWCHDGVCGLFETYDDRADRWYRNVKLTFDQNIAYHALVTLDQCIYVVGGYTATKYLNTTRKFDCHLKVWTEVAPMHAKRCYVCAAALNDQVYACGGFDGFVRHSSVEYYNPARNQWVVAASMRQVRSDAGATALGGKLYVAGGFNGQHCLDTAEMYDPNTDQWSDIESLSSPRSGVALVKYRRSVYAIGGFSGNRRLKTVEKYDPRVSHWVMVADMGIGRSNFAATVCDGLLFAIGGYDGTSTTAQVECYDIYEDEWFSSASLLTGRSATSACTVVDLQNVRDYTYYGRDPKFICSNIRNYD
ncbi:kelch-like protein 10 [Haliotis cracherodii]|uniref:kelch-like protein 10 n=1 Tax=Haliotis cracherodii TaxID=6455 RepID=UPI0039E8CF41